MIDAGEQAVVASGTVSFQGEPAFPGLEDRLDPSAGSEQGLLCGGAYGVGCGVGAFRAYEVDVLPVAEPVELRAGEPAVGQDDLPGGDQC
ncbi:hypothetical protein J3R03_005384 [Actinoplanes couchii]|uniref:Uncharacterized protein n=1 Tax=Actinoplanes couchii TaxID=403638 RepID=A0ABQ3XCT9_9ACTN|nr:hypothetical protein [Actinoplanes couchii]MDR6321188.1 hypothetical protein [Actinoplanes couchii]GID56296.1 hypothetical protein Aco03nite_047000 [Actinoplanes couchii]